jgi:hypothetical protein
LYQGAELDIYMRTELLEEIWVIRNHLAVVTDDFLVQEAWLTDHKCLTIVSTAIYGITVLADNSHFRKLLWVPLLAY